MDTVISTNFVTSNAVFRAYFSLGLSHATIVYFLEEYHNIHFNIRILERKLSALGLRRHNFTNVLHDMLLQAITQELADSGDTVGYRHICCHYGKCIN